MTDERLAAAVERACKRLYADQFTGDAPLLMEAARRLAERGAVQEPVATLHDDGYFTWKSNDIRLRYSRDHAGWQMELYAAPPPVAQPAVPEGDGNRNERGAARLGRAGQGGER